MPSAKPKLLFLVDEDLINRIDDFRYKNRIPSRSEAIQQLIALELYKPVKPSKKPKSCQTPGRHIAIM